MYISVYDENKKHIENINNVTFELTQRVYDFDNFNARRTLLLIFPTNVL